ncbi:MAG: cation acetate symporter [Gammaproteobacteria bacterium]|nr:cation acetate symporter [Gammaproteobacteria bacterium]
MSGGRILAAGLALALLAPAASAQTVGEEWRSLTFSVFALIIALTMYVTWRAASKVRTSADFYAAGSGVSGLQNGWAIAGDYLSAASFLGIAGLISLYGYDGFMYSVGWLVAYVTVLLVIAEPCRNIGKYTMGDILAFRNNPRVVRAAMALSTITVATFYLTAQMVGGGVLVKTLIGLDYEVSVIAVGVLMLSYVLFGGMVATTYVQIIKAILLVLASLVMVCLVWSQYGFAGPHYFEQVVGNPGVQARVASLLGEAGSTLGPLELGQRFLEPGLYLKSPIDQISLGMALVLGTAGMPHILMRFFTVPTAQAARTSVIWAMAIIGGFYVLTLFLGTGAAMMVGPERIMAADKGGNMAAPLLAQYLGGGPDALLGNLMLSFVAAVAFATIVAVVAGLVLAAASAMSHDIWVGVIKGDQATDAEETRAARICSLIVGAVAITIGILAQGQNVAHLVALAFAVAASANLPVILLTLYWRRCNTAGCIAGLVVGAASAVGLLLVSPNMSYPLQQRAVQEEIIATQTARMTSLEQDSTLTIEARVQALAAAGAATAQARAELDRLGTATTSLVGLAAPWFPLRNPGLVSIPLGFLAVFLGSLLYRDPRAEAKWQELHVRANTGIGRSAASAH